MNTAVLWTGGKDCSLAFHKAQQAGYNITHLVTFMPESANFRAHSLHLMRLQIEAIGLPHIKLLVKPPMKESYEDQIQHLKTNYQIETLVTGDIDEIENHDNWIEKCCEKSGMKVFNPLWKKNREDLLKELINSNFNTIFTLVKKPFFDASWLGRKITLKVLIELQQKGIDMCGENGEYHTMVIGAPFFQLDIKLPSYSIVETENYYYIDLKSD